MGNGAGNPLLRRLTSLGPRIGLIASVIGIFVFVTGYQSVWDLWRERRMSQLTRALDGHEDRVNSIAFSRDSTLLLTASEDRTARVWDVDTGRNLLTLRGHDDEVTDAVFSPDGRRIATSGGEDCTARVWDARSGERVLTLLGHQHKEVAVKDASPYCSVKQVRFSADGQRIATAGSDATVRLWDAHSGAQQMTLRAVTYDVKSFAMSPDDTRIAAIGEAENLVTVWDTRTGKELFPPLSHNYFVTSVTFSPDGSRIASSGYDNVAIVWDAYSGRELFRLVGHELRQDTYGSKRLRGIVFSVVFSSDGTRIATSGYDGTARLWDARSGKPLMTLRDQAEVVASVTFSPMGTRLAASEPGGIVRTWDAFSGKELLKLQSNSEYSFKIAFSPDGRWLAAGEPEGEVWLWEISGLL